MPFLSSPRNRLSNIKSVGVAFLAFLGATLNVRSLTLPNDGFNPNLNGTVNAVQLQSDGKILIGGYFTQLNAPGSTVSGHAYIARLNHDGTADTTFTPNASDVVDTITLQTNGQILISGKFTSVTPTGSTTAVARNYIARLNADGTVDTTFNPNPNAVVYAVAYQPNGQVIIGGAFTTVQPTGASSPITRNHIARFNADGSLDTTFNPNTDKTVLALAIAPSGQILVGGGFSTLQPNGSSAATTRNCVARLNSDGSLDTGFDPEPNASVDTILVLPSGQIILGGDFTTLQPNGATTYTQCDFLARVNTDGSLDTTYIINPLGSVSTVAIQPDGRLIIGGSFTQIYPANGLTSSDAEYIARINPDGSLDGGFVVTPNQAVNAIAVQSDGDIILGGYFTSFQPADATGSITRNYIARVTTYGTLDDSVATDSEGTVLKTVQQSNGQIIIAGTFLSVGGVTQSFLARLNLDGSLDTTYAPQLNGTVQAMALQTDGKLVIAGTFTSVDGFYRGYIARLNTDGTLDGAFNPTANSSIFAMSILSNGQILVGGEFTAFTPNGSTYTYSIGYLARINTDGSLDTTFNPAPSDAVFAINVLSDGRILVGGAFTTMQTTTVGYCARLLSTGVVDPSVFQPEPNGIVYAIAVQSDGKVILGGSFAGVLPQTGKAGGSTSTYTDAGGNTVTIPQAGYNATTAIYCNHLVRLNTDGEFDTTFVPPDPSADVLGLALLSDGSLVVTGAMTSFAPNGTTTGTIRNYIGKVSSTGALDPTFNPNANALVNSAMVLADGRILIGGSFSTLQPTGATTFTYANHVAILSTAGALDSTFTAGANSQATGQVNTVVQQANGQFILGGSFSPIGGNPASYIARFNPDGSTDNTFYPNIDGPIYAISVLPTGSTTLTATSSAVWLESNSNVRETFTATTSGEVVAVAQQSDGKVIVAGEFYGFDGATSQSNIIRLNADGSLDTTFTTTTNGLVSVILIQPDGKILIGGDFTTVFNSSTSYLARLNTDGSLDTTFSPQPNLQVISLALQSNGQILLGGDFTYLAFGTTTATPVSYLARINSDGTRDTSFEPQPNGPVYQIAVLSNGQIMAAGAFTGFTPNNATTLTTIQYLARINSNGSIDTTYYPDPNGPVASFVMLSTGQLIAAGSFTAFEQNPNLTGLVSGDAGYITPGTTVTRYYIARVNADGTVDSTFNPSPNGALTSVALASNGQIYFGGSFSEVEPNLEGYPVARSNVARVNTDGSLDATFDPSFNGTVNTIVPLADGSVFLGGNFSSIQVGGAFLVGGTFAHISGNANSNLGMLNSDGTYNASYTPNPNGTVYGITALMNGQALVVGAFTTMAGLPSPYIARVNSDGSLDTSFNAPTDAPVNTVQVQPNGQILMGGQFSKVNNQSSPYLARVSSTGSLDTSFAPSLNGAVNGLVIQPNGQIVIAGAFTSVNGQAVGGIARLNSDGTLDSSFNPNATGTVNAVTLQVDGTYFVGGAFTSIGGQPISGAAHILADGSVDTAFNPSPNGDVNSVTVQFDGKIIIGGAFTKAGGLSRNQFARFPALSVATQSVLVSSDQSTITWTRGGSSPAVSAVVFAESIDGSHWTNVGTATSSNGSTWSVTGLPPSGASLFEVRITGVVPASKFSSAGLVQSTYLENSLAEPQIDSASAVTATVGSSFAYTITATAFPTIFTATGLPPGLSLNTSTGIITGTPTTAGTYVVTVTAANGGAIATATVTITVAASSSGQTTSTDRLINISTRSDLPGSQVLIAGFVISGTTSKPVLIRAVGPGLANFGVSGYMAEPELELISSTGALLDTNTGWGGSSALSAVFTQVGAFSLSPTSLDCALVETLAPGSYTVHVYDPTATGGVVLTEIYDASASPLTDSAKLINISARGTVSHGQGALIGGFVISGSNNQSVLIRGVGPGLAAYGVTDSLADPVLQVFDQNDNLVAQNSTWTVQTVSSPYQSAIGAADITAADSSVGAFTLTSQADTALIVDLPPGAYTFQITSASDGTGEALGEIYVLP